MKVNINLYWKYQGLYGCIVIQNIKQKIHQQFEKKNGCDHKFVKHFATTFRKELLNFQTKVCFAYNCQGQI